MQQTARNLTMAKVGFLNGCRYLLHDRDAKFCAGFDGILEAVGLKVLKLPPRSPNLSAHLERWNRSIDGIIKTRERFGGLLKFYHRKAA